MIIKFEGCYLPNGNVVIEHLNAKESLFCCDQLRNSPSDIQFSKADKRFWRSGGYIDLGCGGFGNHHLRGDDIEKCPFCGADLTNIDIEIRGHQSINELHEYMANHALDH